MCNWENGSNPSCSSLPTDGATSFGPAITFNVGWQLCYMLGLSDGTLTKVAIDMTVMEIASATLQIVLLRKSVDLWLAAAISIPCIVCTYIGQELMIQLDGSGLKLALAAILLFMAAYRIYANCGSRAPKANRPVPAGLDLTRKRTLLSICWWFGIAGLMGGITSIGGTLHSSNLYQEHHSHSEDPWKVLRVALSLQDLP